MENTETGVPITPLEPATPINPHLFRLEVETKVYAAYFLKEVPFKEHPDYDYGGPEKPLDPDFQQPGEPEEEGISPLSDEVPEEPTTPSEPEEPTEPEEPEPIVPPTTQWEPVIFDTDANLDNLLKRVAKMFKPYEHQTPLYIGVFHTRAYLEGQGTIEHTPIAPVTEEEAPTSAFFRNSCDDLWQPGVFNGKIFTQDTPILDEPQTVYVNEADNTSYLQATPFTKESAFLEGTNITTLVTVKPFDPGQGLPPLTGEPDSEEKAPVELPKVYTPTGNSELASRIQGYPFSPVGPRFYW